MQSSEWLQAIKTCIVLDQMRATVALLFTEGMSKVNHFNSNEQICTPQPTLGERLGSCFQSHADKKDTEYSK